jgi:hypothetical protein
MGIANIGAGQSAINFLFVYHHLNNLLLGICNSIAPNIGNT